MPVPEPLASAVTRALTSPGGEAAEAFVGALVAVELFYRVILPLGARLTLPSVSRLLARSKHAVRALAISFAGAQTVRLAPMSMRGGLSELARLAVVFSVGWIAVSASGILVDLAESRYDVTVADNRTARQAVTQLQLVRRVTVVAITVITILVALITLPEVRTVGATLLASAGVLGIVAGIAGQSTLGNLIAGIQVAFSDSLRLGDVVVVEGEWGTIEDLTLTYVVVQIWDQRRLVLPVSYFVTQPFQNWTRTSSQILGTVLLYVDYTVPVEEIRREFLDYIREAPLWDRRVGVLQVVDTTESAVQLRALVSTVTAGDSWNLRCQVREHLVEYLRDHHPSALPRSRVELGGTADGPRPDGRETDASRESSLAGASDTRRGRTLRRGGRA